MTQVAPAGLATSPVLPRGADFHPRGWLRSGHMQTVLSSSPLRRLAQRPMRRLMAAHAEPVVLDVLDGVRLAGMLTRQSQRAEPRGLAVVLHGWEGSIDSSYMVQIGARLLRDGWDVFRFNFRDHGGTYALNTELFHSCLIGEVVAAVGEAARRWHRAGTPLVLAGFSLGGNFALRVALAAPSAGIRLDRVVAVCPVIDPEANLDALEQAWMYHWYFMRKWRSSLRRKQRLFPDEHFFDPPDLRQGLRELTRTLIERRTDFGSLDAYLDGYSVAGTRMAQLAVPTTILTARNDPVVPVADFERLQLPPCVELDIAEHGGHCGFLMDWHCRTFTDDYIAARFNALAP